MSDKELEGINQEWGQEWGQTPPRGYVPQQYKNGKNPVLAIILTFLIMLAFLAIQVVVILPFMVKSVSRVVVDSPELMLDEQEFTDALLGSIDYVEVSMLATFVSMVVAILWYRFVYCKGYSFADLKKSCKKIMTGRTILGLFLAAVCLYYASNFILLIVSLVSPSAIDDYNELMESAGLTIINWKIIVMTVIMAPINEECIMRGIIFTMLKKNIAPIAAILISALYFGIFHLNVVQGIYAGLLGIFMAYIAYKYKSIIASMIFHAMFNGLNFLLLLTPQGFQESVILMIAIPIITGILWFFVEGKRKIADIE
ncbi:MAG: CPBP family intramembrane metalloprotease [Lachnospiraceae bacterium]|nr:CPBP family intramembrane metalloprotease [Lachnospiraceae bacterium]